MIDYKKERLENFKIPQGKNASENEQIAINSSDFSFWNETTGIAHNIKAFGNIDITRADLTTQITNKTLLPNYTYTVIDYPNNGNNDAPQKVILTALTTSLLNRRAIYKTKVPDYQKTNALNLGIWQTSLTPVVGNIVIDYGTQFVNLTGTNGTQTPWSDATDNHPPTAFINNIINHIVSTKGLDYAQRTLLIGFNESATRTITTYLTWE